MRGMGYDWMESLYSKFKSMHRYLQVDERKGRLDDLVRSLATVLVTAQMYKREEIEMNA
jgi:hypothetical protein